MPQFFFSTILCFVALVYNSFFFFFRTAFVRKLFDIRFSYKHCNFSRGCLLVKMASKTVTRSTIFCFTAKSLVANEGLDEVNPKLSNGLKLNRQPSKMQININRQKVSRYFFFLNLAISANLHRLRLALAPGESLNCKASELALSGNIWKCYN